MIPVKICLDKLIIYAPYELDPELLKIVADEVNVLGVEMRKADVERVELVTTQSPEAVRRTKKRIEHRLQMEERKRRGLKQM